MLPYSCRVLLMPSQERRRRMLLRSVCTFTTMRGSARSTTLGKCSSNRRKDSAPPRGSTLQEVKRGRECLWSAHPGMPDAPLLKQRIHGMFEVGDLVRVDRLHIQHERRKKTTPSE